MSRPGPLLWPIGQFYAGCSEMPILREIVAQVPRFERKVGVTFEPFSIGIIGGTDTVFEEEFSCGNFDPEFVTVVVRRGLSRSGKIDRDKLMKFRIPAVDSETQLAYVAAVEAYEPIENAFNSNKRQFARAEVEFMNNSSATSCEYFKSIADNGVLNIGEKLRQLNVLGFRGLLESLPYHLASILRLFDAARRSKDKLEHLQHFFEAAAAYHVSLLFSAMMNRRDEAVREFSAIDEKLSRFSLTLRKSTFGSWVVCVESFPRFFAEDAPLFERIRALPILNSACSPGVISAFRFANQARNGGTGHGGHVNEATAAKLVSLLTSHLNTYLEATAEMWDDLIMVSKSEIKDFRSGEITYSVKTLVGTKPALVDRDIRVIPDREFSDGLDVDCLYYYSQSTKRAFPVVDLVGLDGPHPGGVMLPIFFNKMLGTDNVFFEYKCYCESLPPVVRQSVFLSNWPSLPLG